jgi:ribosomal protein L11 methylase PrmA
MKIISIFLSSINKYGLKFLILILIYEIFNLYRLRFSDYVVLNSINKNFEPTVPTPYYCLSLLKNNIPKKKYNFIDFGCGTGRVITYIKKVENINKIIGIENNFKLKKKLNKLKDSRTKIFINDCSDNNFLNLISKEKKNQNIILYFYHPFSAQILNLILEKFLLTNKKEVVIIIMGEIFIKKKLKRKFNLKQKKLHKLFNIYNYKYH